MPASRDGRARKRGNLACIAAGFTAEYDPVDRVATWVIRGDVVERTRHNVRLFAPKDPNDASGVRAFDGAPLEKEFTFAFTTGVRPRPAGSEPPRKLGFCDARRHCPLPSRGVRRPDAGGGNERPHAFLAANCTSGGNCHAGGSRRGFGAAIRRRRRRRRLCERQFASSSTDVVVASETATGADPARRAATRSPRSDATCRTSTPRTRQQLPPLQADLGAGAALPARSERRMRRRTWRPLARRKESTRRGTYSGRFLRLHGDRRSRRATRLVGRCPTTVRFSRSADEGGRAR